MASVNRAVKLRTHEGAPAAQINPTQQLERSVMACLLWEDSFYESGVSIAERIEQLCAVVKPEDVADIARRAKHEMRLRHVPLLLIRELFKRKEAREEAGKLLTECVTRPDDMAEFLSLYWRKGKEPLAKQAQKALARAFPKFNEYTLAKYNGGQKAVKLRDVLRLGHAKPANDDQSALWKRLNEGTLATPDTWEVELSTHHSPNQFPIL
jgi:60 kDa SS-A/Ro ribonucleoprotein